jgi:hypothetical protein
LRHGGLVYLGPGYLKYKNDLFEKEFGLHEQESSGKGSVVLIALERKRNEM